MEKSIRKIETEQFESIRKSGICNMIDMNCVQNAAESFGMFELADMDKMDYIYLLKNYSKLMKD